MPSYVATRMRERDYHREVNNHKPAHMHKFRVAVSQLRGVGKWERTLSGNSIRIFKQSYLIAVVSLEKNNSNKYTWFVTNKLANTSQTGEEPTIEYAKNKACDVLMSLK